MTVLEDILFPFPVECYRIGTNNNYNISRIQGRNNGFSPYRLRYTSPVGVSAASSSLTGSDAGFPEQQLDSKAKQKRRKIAGIDQDELLEPNMLADPDSCFCEFKGVKIHYKVCDPESQAQNSFQTQSQCLSLLANQSNKVVPLPMILLHGFGASVYSWNRVMKPLTDITGSKVLAFDRPAFGLTSRVTYFGHSEDKKSLNPYGTAFSVLATLHFIDFLAAEKAILVGHSAGSLIAVNSYFQAPERVAALILIAPAIMAPLSVHKTGAETQLEEDNQSKECKISTPFNPLRQLFKIFLKYSKFIVLAIMGIMKRMAEMVNSLYKMILSALLRSAFFLVLVRMAIDKFGIAAIRTAWCDSSQVKEHVLHGYTKPLRIKDWDKALVEYTAAMLTDTDSESHPPLSERLHEISCPVLIVTGDRDRIVPAWNAEKLSRAIPGSTLEVIKQCGHLPHEEKVDEFVLAVQKFLQRAIGDSEQQRLQMV